MLSGCRIRRSSRQSASISTRSDSESGEPQRLVPHGVKLPHGMKRTASGRYIVYGSMDNPADAAAGEARHVGIWDRRTDRVTVLQLPATCWHVAVHPREDIFYAVSFRVSPQDNRDYHEWGMAYLKEYAFEIDAREKRVSRHWAAGREIPAHINSDITLSDSELIFCNGGSQSIIAIELDNFARFRIIDERPDLAAHLARPREVATQIYEAFARGSFATNSRHFLGALRVSRFSLLDSIYACQLSADQSLLFTANRGLNCITIYDYPAGEVRIRVPMPELQNILPMAISTRRSEARLSPQRLARLGALLRQLECRCGFDNGAQIARNDGGHDRFDKAGHHRFDAGQ